MKNRKFVSKGILAFLLSSSLLLPSAGYADAEKKLEVSNIQANKGDTIEIPITLTSPGGIRGLQFDLSFDSSKLTLIDFTPGTLISSSLYFGKNVDNHRVVIAGMGFSLPEGTGTVAKAVFRVNDGATNSNPIRLQNVMISNEQAENQTTEFGFENGTISVDQPAPVPPANEQTPPGGGGSAGGGSVGGGSASTGGALPAPATPSVPAADQVLWDAKQIKQENQKLTATLDPSMVNPTMQYNTLSLTLPVDAKIHQIGIQVPSSAIQALIAKKVEQVIVQANEEVQVKIPVKEMQAANGDWSFHIQKTQEKQGVASYQVDTASSVTVAVDLTSKKNQIQDQELLTAFIWDGAAWKPIGGKYEADEQTMVFPLHQSGRIVIQSSQANPHDLAPVQSWAARPIQVMVGKGFMEEHRGGQFDPMTSITRAEFVQLIVRTLGKAPVTGTASFTDVQPQTPYYQEIMTAAQLGIVKGVNDQQFNPQRSITREEMAVILSRALGNLQPDSSAELTSLEQFADGSHISSWAQQAVAETIQHNWMQGFGNKQFKPKEQASRAQAAVMMYRYFTQQ